MAKVCRFDLMKCSLHGKQLIESPAFCLQGDWSPDGFSLELFSRFPNAIPFDCRLSPDEFYTEPESVSYCPDCETEARVARAARSKEK